MYPAGDSGISVRYMTFPGWPSIRVVESGPPDGHAVLLLHGWGECIYAFAETIPALAQKGHRVVAFDLPGHGLSDLPDDERRFTTPELSNLALSVADGARMRRFDLIGHSMGGAVALELATRPDPRLGRLALLNPVGLGAVPIIAPVKLLTPPIINRVVPMLLGRRTIDLILQVAFGTRDRPTERDIDEYWAPTQYDNLAIACRACVHRVTWSRVAATKLRSLRVPVLVVVGGRDPLVRGVAKRARLIPNARVVSIREGGHLVQQECAPRTNDELLQFLGGR